jgi:hypothetical protein
MKQNKSFSDFLDDPTFQNDLEDDIRRDKRRDAEEEEEAIANGEG